MVAPSTTAGLKESARHRSAPRHFAVSRQVRDGGLTPQPFAERATRPAERRADRRASRGERARSRQSRHDQQQQRRHRVADGSDGVTEQQRPDEARQRDRAADDDDHAGERELHAAADDHPQHVAGPRADRMQSDLAGPCHAVGDDAETSPPPGTARPRQRATAWQHREALLRDRLADDRRERLIGHGQRRIDVPHGVSPPPRVAPGLWSRPAPTSSRRCPASAARIVSAPPASRPL